MIFNHATSKQTLYEDALYWAGANKSTYTIDEFTRNANFGLDRAISLIKKNDKRWKWADNNNPNMDVGVTDLVATQDNYTLEVDMFEVTRLRVKGPDGNWITLKPIDNRDASDDLLNTYGTPEFYDKQGLSIIPLPIPNYSADEGFEIHFGGGPVYFETTDTDKEPGFNPLYHRLISLYAALDWLVDKSTVKNPLTHKINRVKERITEMEMELESHYQNRDEDDVPILKPKRSNRNVGLSL